MRPVNFLGVTRILGPPANWDPAELGPCDELPIRQDGFTIESVWRPTPEELATLNRGGGVRLTVVGAQHPVVSLDAVEPEALAA